MKNTNYDVAIIGQGPAGMTAALYAARSGLRTVAFEQMGSGGQMVTAEQLDNYPGFQDGVEPFTLAFAMSGQAQRFGADMVNEEVATLDLQANPKRITLTSGVVYYARAVILAMGAEPRYLGLPNETALRGHGVSYCANCDAGFFRGQTAVVVGGGNTAAVDAIYLSRLCSQVHLVHRRDYLRADDVYVQTLESLPNLQIHYNFVVDALEEQDGKVSGVQVRNLQTDESSLIPTAALFVAVGIQPKNALLQNSGLSLDPAGYVQANESCITNIPGVFVAGDLRTKPLRQVVTATADGANAATAAFEFLSVHHAS